MNETGLEQYQHLIDQLKTSFNHANFEQKFNDATQSLTKPQRLLVKMELRRLAQPCNRFIDLRGKVDGEVRQYEYQTRPHFLDEVAINVFEQGVKAYGDYTIGVYEDVINAFNNFRVMGKSRKTDRVDKEQLQLVHNTYIAANKVEFSSYGIRDEERMNYIISVDVQLDNGNIVKAKTSDLSKTGCKLKFPSDEDVQLHQEVGLFFVDLEKEFTLKQSDVITYDVVGIDPIDSEFHYLRLARQDAGNVELDKFLERFIHGNKRRYRVNLDNTLDAVVIKGHEQFYFPRLTSVAVLLNSDDNLELYPSAALNTENSKTLLRYFSNESKQLVISQILNQKRIDAINDQHEELKETTLFCFTHSQKGRIYHYSATSIELNKNLDLRSLFLGFGSTKPSWRVFKLQVLDAHEEDAHIRLSLPDKASEEVKKMNKPPSPRVEGLVKNAAYMVVMTNLTLENSHLQYQSYKFEQAQVNQLQQFVHKKLTSYKPIEHAAIEYINLRTESRYLYNTEIVLLDQPEGNIKGHSVDFSINGMQIELEKAVDIEKGELVLLAMPKMQKITKTYRLDRLPYEVVAVHKGGKVINLRIYNYGDTHIGKEFFEQIIKSNRSKLATADDTPRIQGLSTALRNIYAKNLTGTPFYIGRNGSRYTLQDIGQGKTPNYFHHLMSKFANEKSDFNVYPLVKQNMLNTWFSFELKKLSREDKPAHHDVFVRYRSSIDKVEEAITCVYDHELRTANTQKHFIDTATRHDTFFCFRMYYSRTGRPDMEYISSELQYVSQYAIHKAKKLEEALWSVVVVGEFVDITEETMIRHGYTQETIEAQLEKRKELLPNLH